MKVDLASQIRYTAEMNQGIRPHQRGFTLIEMMTVITIVIILTGITVAGFSFINDKQANAKAKIDIELLSKGIEQYKLDWGEYPSSIDSDGSPVPDENIDPISSSDDAPSQILYNRLFFDGYETRQDADESDDLTIYVKELDPRSGKQTWVERARNDVVSRDLTIVDPWGRPYLYRKGVNSQNPDFDLWSTGKDGETSLSDPSQTVEENKDDVRNF